MNKAKLTYMCHKVSDDTGLNYNSVLAYYFLESILKCLANSEYKENIIFKGGLLISNVVGIRERTTIDIDFLLHNIDLTESMIRNVLEEAFVCSDNSIKYTIEKILTIREKDEYGGFRIIVLCKLDNIIQKVPLDIATGDIITPNPIEYRYTSVFDKNEIMIYSYPIETIIAEKLETIISRGFLNSRSKDFYDLYIIYKLKYEYINIEILLSACERTFSYRKTNFDINEINKMLFNLIEDETFLKRWTVYQNKNSFVKDVQFQLVINSIIDLVGELKEKIEKQIVVTKEQSNGSKVEIVY